MRITSRELFPEDNHGQIILQIAGSTAFTIDGTGKVQSLTAVTPSLTSAAIAGLTATSTALTSPTFTGTINVGGASDSVGFFGTTAATVQSSTATTAAQAFVGGGATAATSASRWSGNTGTRTYTIGDIVSALKAYGLITA